MIFQNMSEDSQTKCIKSLSTDPIYLPLKNGSLINLETGITLKEELKIPAIGDDMIILEEESLFDFRTQLQEAKTKITESLNLQDIKLSNFLPSFSLSIFNGVKWAIYGFIIYKVASLIIKWRNGKNWN